MNLRPCSALLTLLVAALPAAADVKLPALFSSHMVLQRGTPVPIWGRADPGERVTVAVRPTTGGAESPAPLLLLEYHYTARACLSQSAANTEKALQGPNKARIGRWTGAAAVRALRGEKPLYGGKNGRSSQSPGIAAVGGTPSRS